MNYKINHSLVLIVSTFMFQFSSQAQWIESSENGFFSMFDLAYPDTCCAYISSDFGIVLKSEDQGETWAELYDFGPFSSLSNINFYDANIGFVSSNGGVYRTLDAGNTWNSISMIWGTSTSTLPIHFIKIADDRIYASFAEGDSSFFVSSDDFGTHWDTVFIHEEPNAKPFMFSMIDSLIGLFINPNQLQEIYTSYDGAYTLTDTHHISNGAIILQSDFDFIDTTFGFMYGYGQPYYSSMSLFGGTSFHQINLDGSQLLPVLDLDYSSSKLYASSFYGKIFTSNNNGFSWSEQSTPIDEKINTVAFASPTHGIALSHQSVIYTENGGLLNIDDLEPNLHIQIYPNPAKTSIHLVAETKINIQSIKLLDINGKLIKTYTPKQSVLDIKGLPVGVYILNLKTEHGMLSERVIIE
ncbi:MAG: T9SS type A sorting domain-containing protein [Flavobacteriales bacterium]